MEKSYEDANSPYSDPENLTPVTCRELLDKTPDEVVAWLNSTKERSSLNWPKIKRRMLVISSSHFSSNPKLFDNYQKIVVRLDKYFA